MSSPLSPQDNSILYEANEDSLDAESQINKEDSAKYIDHCSRLGIEPIFEFLVAISDPNVTECDLSQRRSPLEDDDIVPIATSMSTQDPPHIRVLNLNQNCITSAGAAEISIMLHSSTSVRTLKLGSNSLEDEGFESLCNSQGFYLLEYLDVSNNGITEKGVEHWLTRSTTRKYLDQNAHLQCNLQHLNLQQNILKDESFSLWSTVLLDNLHIKLESVNLRACEIGDKGAMYISEFIKRSSSRFGTLREIDLGANKIGAEGALHLANALDQNTSVFKFNLRSNQIGDDGAKAFAQVFKKDNNEVRELYLGHNQMHLEGIVALSDLLQYNTKLEKFDIQGVMLDLHSTQIMAAALRNNKDLTQLIIDIDTSSNEAAKMLADALQSNHTLQDLIIGGDVKLDERITNSISHSLNLNKYLAENPDKKMDTIREKILNDQDQIQNLQEKVTHIQNQLEEERQRSKDLEKQVESTRDHIKEKEEQIQKSNETVQSLQNQIEAQKNFDGENYQLQENLQRKLQEESERSTMFQDQYETAAAKLKADQEMLEKQNEKIEQLQEFLERQSKDAESKIQQAEARSKLLEEQLMSVQKQLQNTSKILEEERAKQIQLAKEHETRVPPIVKEEMEDMKKQLTVEKEAKQAIENQLRSEREEMQNRLQKERENLKMQQQLNDETLLEELSKQKQQIEQLELENEAVKSQNHASKLQNSELEMQLEAIRFDIFNIREECNSQKSMVNSLKDQQSQNVNKLLDELHPKIESAVRQLFKQFWPEIQQAIQDHHDKQIEVLQAEQRRDFENITRELRKLELNVQEIGNYSLTGRGDRELSDKVERLGSQIAHTIANMNEKFREYEIQLQEALLTSSIKQPSATALEERLKNYVKNLVGDIQEDFEVVRNYSKQLAHNTLNSSQSLQKETAANVKKDLSGYINSAVLDSESKLLNKITDVDYKHTQLIHDLERNFDQKYETHQRMLSLIQNRERTLEEEGIRTKLSQNQISEEVGLEIQRRTREIEKRMQNEIDDLSTSYKSHIELLERQNQDYEKRMSSYENIINSLNLRLSELETRSSGDLLSKDSRRSDSLWNTNTGQRMSSIPSKETSVGFSPIPQKRFDNHRLSVSRRVIPSNPYNDRTDDVQKRVSRLAKRVEGLEEFFNQDKPDTSFFSLDDLNH